MQKDILNSGVIANIIPFLNIGDFVKDEVDKIEHSLNHVEMLDDLEDFLIEETEEYLNKMTNYELSDLLSESLFSQKLTAVIKIQSEIFEGLEDPEIHAIHSLPDTSVHINFYYEMRRVNLVITIDAVAYRQYASELEGITGLYNVEYDNDVVELSSIVRIYRCQY